MAAGTWKVFWEAKRNFGKAALNINTGATLKLSLHKAAASANLLSKVASIWSSIGSEITARTGYTAGGKALPGVKWTISGSAMKFSYTTAGIVFTATVSALTSIKYAVIRTSIGATSGRPICYVNLSTGAFDLAVNNTLTILPAGTGVFTMT